MLDVEFEWFDPQPEHDFQGLKVLLRQLFDIDAVSFNLSELADLVLAQPLLGSTVKVEGNESDPYAFLTVLSLQEHQVSTNVKVDPILMLIIYSLSRLCRILSSISLSKPGQTRLYRHSVIYWTPAVRLGLVWS